MNWDAPLPTASRPPSRRPLPVTVRLTEHNRNSVAALLGVLERSLPAGTVTLDVARDHGQLPPDGLGLYSFMTAHAGDAAREVALLRRAGCRTVLLAGGPHPSGDPAGALALGFDAVFVGEAGSTLAAWIRQFATAGPAPRGIVRLADRPSLDEYPPWPSSPRLFAQVEISRGCPMGCAFCQTPRLHGRRPRHRSLGAIRRALAHSAEAGHVYTRFVSPNAFGYGSPNGRRPSPAHIEALLCTARSAGMRRIYFGTFPSEVRPESVTAPVLRLVRQLCDNRSISIGVQSGSDRLLRAMRRGHSVAQAIGAVERIAAAGLQPQVDFLFGLPGETAQDRALTRRVMAQLADQFGARIHGHGFEPLPGSALEHASPSEVDRATLELCEQLRGRGLATGSLARRRGMPRAGRAPRRAEDQL